MYDPTLTAPERARLLWRAALREIAEAEDACWGNLTEAEYQAATARREQASADEQAAFAAYMATCTAAGTRTILFDAHVDIIPQDRPISNTEVAGVER